MKDKSKKQIFFGMIFIPLLVSLLGEKIISPLFDITISLFLSIGSHSITYITDMVYSRISSGSRVDFSFYTFVLLFSYFMGGFGANMIGIRNDAKITTPQSNTPEDNSPKEDHDLAKSVDSAKACLSIAELEKELIELNKERESLMKKSAHRYKILRIIYVLLWCIYIIFTFTVTYIDSTVSRLTRNIEIVSPYISDQEYKNLKSAFYSMDSREDYTNLVNALEEISSEHGIELK